VWKSGTVLCWGRGEGSCHPQIWALPPAPQMFWLQQHFAVYQGCSFAFRIRQNAFLAGALSQTLLGELTMLPQTDGEGNTPSPYPTSLSTFCASILTPLAPQFLRVFSSRTALAKLLHYTVKHLLLNQSATFSITAAKRSTSQISLDSLTSTSATLLTRTVNQFTADCGDFR